MKRIVLLAIPAIALLASCAKNEVSPVENDPQQITFKAVVSRQSTKAMVDGTVYPTDLPFGSYAFFLEKDKDWDVNSADAQIYIPQSEVKNTTSATSGTAWTTATPYYWPKQGSLTFFSYSPYVDALNKATTCTKEDGIKISSWDLDDYQDIDIMVADYQADQTRNTSNANYTGVPTIFRHKLSQIVKFTFKTKEDYCGGRTEATAQVGDKFFYINSVKINNINCIGTYTSTNKVGGNALGSWDVQSDTNNYTWYEDQTGTLFGKNGAEAVPNKLQNNNQYLLVLPQTFIEPANTDNVTGNKNIQITYTIKTYNGTGFSTETVKDVYTSLFAIQGGTSSEEAKPWTMNKKISYTITIGLDQIYWAPSVVDWEKEDFSYDLAK